ncbi:disulfide bond formation protein DsbA [Yinghuangia seranimata]|uniref:mycothiol-dependent nitroreductase Rv2466c family protein n=1 Tax=Yinghuangia seranimata TaxID=408067 RepID=UPI00248C840A|nr:disulfide bond formation protein DsbA [Yinghuangia seranimata]MDI2126499.1 disulfide bond formation protein DsbA [Yinghuangia seranimata]
MWFDPKCPWAWNTSRWLLEVEQVRDVRVRFQVMSLWLLNDGREGLDDWYAEWLSDTLGPVRVLTAAEQKYGADVLRDLYTAFGNRIHHSRTPIGPELYADVLAELGLAPELAAAADSAEYDEALLASHRAGLDPVGEDLGTPAIHVTSAAGDVNAFFGPVVTPVPRGEAAGLLWDGVVLVSATPGFYELKRGRNVRPSVD